jgi:hypothetical protein
MSAWDTSIRATVARLRRVYACKSNDEVCKVYGVRKWEAAHWHREQDERALARQYIVDWETARDAMKAQGGIDAHEKGCNR